MSLTSRELGSLDCETPANVTALVLDLVLMVIASICLLIVCYGLYKYVQFWRTNTDNYLRPPRYIHYAGLVFFCISLLTLVNALLYDVFYLVCHELDTYERSIYHIVYFAQIYSLWIILFFRVHFVFHNTSFRLSRCVVVSYAACFLSIPLFIVSFLIAFGFQSEAFVTLPYVVMSSIVCTSLLLTFLHKLLQLFCHVRADKEVMQSATKNTLLASISIVCSFLVIAVLVGLYIRHDGNIQEHSVIEELMLELVILIDIVSNFVCVLLTYKFFSKQYYSLCGSLDKKFEVCFRKAVEKTDSRAGITDAERTLSEIVSEYRSRGQTLSVNKSTLSGNTATATSSSAASTQPASASTVSVQMHDPNEVATVDRKHCGDGEREDAGVGHATLERYHSLSEENGRRPVVRYMSRSNPCGPKKKNKFFLKSSNSN